MPDDQDTSTNEPIDEAAPKSQQPAFIRFFFDQEKPLALRAGVGALVLLFVTFPLFASKPKRANEPAVPSSGITEDSFPTGHANLADSDIEEDTLRAVLTSKERQREAERSADRRFKQLTEVEEQPEEQIDTPLPKKIGPFKVLSQLAPNPIAVTLGNENDVWIADHQALIRFTGGDLSAPTVILDKKLYDKEFNDDLSPFSAIGVDSKGVVWAGLSNGQLMRYQRYEWKILTRANEPIRGRYYDFIEYDGEMFAGTRGIWRWDSAFERLVGKREFRRRLVTSFTKSADGTLYASGRGAVWRLNKASKKWETVWKPLKQDGTAYVIRTDRDGTLVVGTKSGIVRLSKKGIAIERMLAEEQITSILIEDKGNIWAGTSRGGLRYWNGKVWHKAGSAEGLVDGIGTLALDKQNRLWIGGLRSGGLFVAPIPDAAKWILQFPEKEKEGEKPQIFAGPCEAADALLKGVTLSGGIATRIIDGRLMVFFNGTQVCPKGVGFHRLDGLVLLLNGWELTIFLDEQRTTIPIPETFAADQVKVTYVDSENRIWLGTDQRGVYRYSEEAWVEYGQHDKLLNNPVRTFQEDATGSIWIGTTPQFDKQQRVFHLPPLHVFSPKTGWYHLGPKEGLAHWGVYRLAILRNESLLAATTGGLSIINQRGEITNITRRDGIKPDFAYATSIDVAGNIWFVHQYFGDGVSWFTGSEVHHVDKKQGLFANRITNLVHDRKNRVWLVSSNGSVGVYPGSFFEENKTTTKLRKQKHISLTKKSTDRK